MKCKVCGNEEGLKSYHIREMMFGSREPFLYFQCPQCCCLQISEIPKNLSKHYPQDYYSFGEFRGYRRSLKGLLLKWRDSYVVRGKGLVGWFLNFKFPNSNFRFLAPLPVTRDTSILDVGCGSGDLLFALRELGLRNLLGIDPFNKHDITYSNGLTIKRGDLKTVSGSWDIIVFHHSFEHLQDPADTLKDVAQRLNPGGHCIIRVPILPSYAWEHYGTDWVQLDAPRHLFIYSVEAIRILAEKSGFHLDKVIHDSTGFQFWGSEQYRQDIPLRDNRSYLVDSTSPLFSKRQIANFNKRAKELNHARQGDQAIFYLSHSYPRPS